MNRAAVPVLCAVFGFFAMLVQFYADLRAGPYVAVVSSTAVCLFLFCLKQQYRQAMAVQSLTIAFAMPLVAWSLSNVWALYLVMGLWVPLMAGRFDRIAPVYLLSFLLLPSLDTEAVIGGVKLFNFGVLDALAIGAALAIYCNPAKGRALLQSDVWVCVLLLTFGAALSRETSLTHFLRTSVNIVFDFGLPYYVLSRGLRSIEELRAAMRWLACGGVILSAILVFEVSRAWAIYRELYALYELPTLILIKSRGGLLRAGGPFVEPTSIAMIMAICLVALWLLRDQFRSRLHFYGLAAVIFIGLSAPQSRGAWIGCFFALAVSDIFLGRYAALARKVLVVAAGVTVVFTAAQFSPYLSESVGLSGHSSETSDYRRELLRRGLEEFWGSPLIGYSTAELEVRLEDMRQGEGIIDYVNTYVWIGLIAGPVGLAAFFGTFLHFLRRIRRMSAAAEDRQTAQTAAFAFSYLAMLLEMLFFTSFGERPAFLTFGLLGFAAALLSIRRPVPVVAPVPEVPRGAVLVAGT
ncbi:O-antigen ligase family protein [Altericroceibacterium xinjiangense]|uniref:O-antigen ligase family protein n=1 Tax=Altericroceibacterium xinjiangense TaxID=762261 RepID=UPI000F7DD60E|nr:O-antigen ligase family protein [Altericroceibacterium xinjiangense]